MTFYSSQLERSFKTKSCKKKQWVFISLGDLRDKIAKRERDEAHRQMMAKRYPKLPTPPPIRCQRGPTVNEAPTTCVHQKDWWSPQQFYCPACLPDELLGLVVG
jgi:hypothetical protein